MRPPDRGTRKGGENWREVWNRRSRLRSATRLLAEANAAPYSSAPPLSSDSSAVVVLDNAADERSPKRPRDTETPLDSRCAEEEEDDIVDPEYSLFLDQLMVDGGSYVLGTPAAASAGTPANPVVIDDDYAPPVCPREGVDCANGDGEVVDPDYDLFLRHLRVDGKSYVLEMTDPASGRLLCLKYEEDDSCNVTPLRAEKSPSKVSSKKKYSKPRKDLKKRRRSAESTESDVEVCMVDEDYQIFLKHVRLINGSMVLELNNVTVRYEEEKDEDEDAGVYSEIDDGSKEEAPVEDQPVSIKTEPIEEESCLRACSHQGSNFSACEDDGCSIVIVSPNMPNFFEERLSDVLQKPFDKTEYDELMYLAKKRRPMEKLKILRSLSKSFGTDKLGRSYLDYYPDLAEKIESADYHDRLALLRGLFYYLENVVHTGSFRPWASASSGYKMLPPGGGNVVHPVPIEISEN